MLPLSLGLLLVSFGTQFFGRLNLFSGPDPSHQKWVVLPAFAILLALFAAGLVASRRGFRGWEIESADGEIQFRRMNGSLLGRQLQVESETKLRHSDFRYLESQHGVILVGPGFHQDLILSKEMEGELLTWLTFNGVLRFTAGGPRP